MRLPLAAALTLVAAGFAGCSSPADRGAQVDACPWMDPLPDRIESGPHVLLLSNKDCLLALEALETSIGSRVQRTTFDPPVPLLQADFAVASSLYKNGTFQTERQGANGSLPHGGDYASIVNATSVATLPLTRQWASGARDADGSASEATGPPDTFPGAGNETAWLTFPGSGERWLELSFDEPTLPVAVRIWEWEIPGFVARIEALDPHTDEWIPLWQGQDGTVYLPGYLDADLAPLAGPTDRLRVVTRADYDSRTHGIDAVELLGADAWDILLRADIDRSDDEGPRSFAVKLNTRDATLGPLSPPAEAP